MSATQNPADRLSMAVILAAVVEEFGVSYDDLMSSRQFKDIARTRQVAMYLGRKATMLSLPQIGRAVGNRHHTTVMHGVDRIAALVKSDRALAQRISRTMDALGRPWTENPAKVDRFYVGWTTDGGLRRHFRTPFLLDTAQRMVAELNGMLPIGGAHVAVPVEQIEAWKAGS